MYEHRVLTVAVAKMVAQITEIVTFRYAGESETMEINYPEIDIDDFSYIPPPSHQYRDWKPPAETLPDGIFEQNDLPWAPPLENNDFRAARQIAAGSTPEERMKGKADVMEQAILKKRKKAEKAEEAEKKAEKRAEEAKEKAEAKEAKEKEEEER
ncbi:hypothetical protein E2P81_ATG01041 [Venturia nashicola]|nr:hypothetical protein E2P81_ATG01041 [Venturia nashicola]